MWRGKTVSVALPTYNERESIRECIDHFFATGLADLARAASDWL